MTTFTPLSKENLIGVMLARCDGDKLGEVVVLQLSKQELTLGPMQINARINQDQNISKDLTLWNEQGSHVLQGQTLVLPVGDTFLYVSPIYLQATQARMPQLKKVVLAVGNRLIYADTYERGAGPARWRRWCSRSCAHASRRRRSNRLACRPAIPRALREVRIRASSAFASICSAIAI